MKRRGFRAANRALALHPSSLMRSSIIACSLVLAVAAALPLILTDGADRPLWVTSVLFWFVFGSVTVLSLLRWRELSPTVTVFVTLFGLTTIVTGYLLNVLGTQTWGLALTDLVFWAPVLGVGLAGVGIWTLDLGALRDGLSKHPGIVVICGLGLLGTQFLFELGSTSLELLLLLWATGLGGAFLPLVVIGGIRWGRTATNPQLLFVILGTAGLILVFLPENTFLAYDWGAHQFRAWERGGTVVQCDVGWGPLEYSESPREEQLSFSDGCNTNIVSDPRESVPRGTIAGTILFVTGLIGDRVFTTRNR